MILLISLICLVLLISYFRINAFLSFLLVAIGAGLAMDLPHLAQTLEKGIGNILLPIYCVYSVRKTFRGA
jgi:Gnt-I system high-affinity gluconate transporter